MSTDLQLVTCQIALTGLEYEQLHALLSEAKRKSPDTSDWIAAVIAHMEEAQKEAQEWERDDEPMDDATRYALGAM